MVTIFTTWCNNKKLYIFFTQSTGTSPVTLTVSTSYLPNHSL